MELSTIKRTGRGNSQPVLPALPQRELLRRAGCGLFYVASRDTVNQAGLRGKHK